MAVERVAVAEDGAVFRVTAAEPLECDAPQPRPTEPR